MNCLTYKMAQRESWLHDDMKENIKEPGKLSAGSHLFKQRVYLPELFTIRTLLNQELRDREKNPF